MANRLDRAGVHAEVNFVAQSQVCSPFVGGANPLKRQPIACREVYRVGVRKPIRHDESRPPTVGEWQSADGARRMPSDNGAKKIGGWKRRGGPSRRYAWKSPLTSPETQVSPAEMPDVSVGDSNASVLQSPDDEGLSDSRDLFPSNWAEAAAVEAVRNAIGKREEFTVE